MPFPFRLQRRDVHNNAAAGIGRLTQACLLYTSDAADERSSVDLGGRRIIKKKKYIDHSGWQMSKTWNNLPEQQNYKVITNTERVVYASNNKIYTGERQKKKRK